MFSTADSQNSSAMLESGVLSPQQKKYDYFPLQEFSRDVFFTFYGIHILSTFWLPLIIIIICYAIIGYSLRRQMNERLALLDQVELQFPYQKKCRASRHTLQAPRPASCAPPSPSSPPSSSHGSLIRHAVSKESAAQVLSILRIICDEGTLCDTLTSKLNWLQVLIIAR